MQNIRSINCVYSCIAVVSPSALNCKGEPYSGERLPCIPVKDNVRNANMRLRRHIFGCCEKVIIFVLAGKQGVAHIDL